MAQARRKTALPALAALLMAAVLLSAASLRGLAQESDPQASDTLALERGKRLFAANCAGCHGQAGLGDGPLAGMLTVSPGNLQEIALNNGGDFPFLRVIDMIDGRKDVAAHGPREDQNPL